jgi:hypothetical protein
MSETISFNGSNYTGIPNTKGETGWQTTLTNYLRAIASGTLQPVGGAFTLTNEVDFGSSYGAKWQYLKDKGANPASSGLWVRASYGSKIGWRNNANTSDNYFVPDASDNLTYNGQIIAGPSGYLPSRAVVTSSASGLTTSTTTATEIGYVGGVTGAIQSQFTTEATARAGVQTNLDTHTANTTTAHGTSGAVVGTANVQTIYTKTFGDPAVFTQVATPGNPGASLMKLYPKSDGFFYTLDSTGAEKKVGSGAGSVNYFSANSDIESGTTGYSVAADGDTATVTLASPSVFTSAHNHGMAVGQPVFLTTTGALPTGFATGTQYYVSVVGAANTFQLSATLGGASINGSVSQSGVHTYRPNIPVTGALANLAATATIAASTSTALRGAKNLLFTPGSVGDYCVYTITPDTADTATMLQLSFDYMLTTPASYVDGDLQVYLYDVGNSQLIQPGPYKILGNLLKGHFSTVFQTPGANMSTIRVIIIQNTTNTAYTSARFDNFACGPQPRTLGAPVSDWVAFTPTGSWVANTTYAGKWRRVGDSMEIQYSLTLAGAPTSASLTLNLPSGYTIDTAKLANSTQFYERFCSGGGWDSSATATYGPFEVLYNSSTSFLLAYPSSTAALLAAVTQAAPVTWAASDAITATVMVPITGWSSNVLMSQDTDTRVVAARYTSTAGAAIGTSPAVIDYATKDFDTHGAVTTGASWKFTVPVPGFYRVSTYNETNSFTTAAAAAVVVDLYKNAAFQARLGQFIGQAAAASTVAGIGGSLLVNCLAGDTLDLRSTRDAGHTPAWGTTAGRQHVQVERVTGPSAIAATEGIACRYTNTAGSTLTKSAANDVPFATKDYDTHGAFATPSFTAPAPGKYRVSANIIIAAGATWANGDAIQLQIFKNGAAHTDAQMAISGAMTAGVGMTVTGTVNCLAGDTIKISCTPTKAAASNVTLDTAAGSNTLCIERVCN